MKLRIAIEMFLTGMLIGGLAFAADEPANPTPAPTPSSTVAAAPAKYYLELDQSDLTTLSQAINELPKRLADPLLLKLNGQLSAQEQLKAAADKSLSEATDKAKKRK